MKEEVETWVEGNFRIINVTATRTQTEYGELQRLPQHEWKSLQCTTRGTRADYVALEVDIYGEFLLDFPDIRTSPAHNTSSYPCQRRGPVLLLLAQLSQRSLTSGYWRHAPDTFSKYFWAGFVLSGT